jgi:hypothetical protein
MLTQKTLGIAVVLLIVGLVPAVSAQSVIYVDDDAATGGDGTTWETAFMHLRDALGVASAGDEIRVAGGTYRPDQDEAGAATPADRTETFTLVSDVTLLGGFRGCPGGSCLGGDPDERDIDVYETVLTGDLNGDDVADMAGFFACYSGDGNVRVPECDPFDLDDDLDVDELDGHLTDNSYHVMTASGTDAATILNGVTIRSGAAIGSAGFDQDKGGGLYNNGGSLTLTRCTLTLNAAAYGGGGAYHVDSAVVVTDCDFIANRVFEGIHLSGGGGLYHVDGTPSVANCRFTGNIARFGGGGFYSDVSAGATITGCTFAENVADTGAGLTIDGGANVVTDCVFTDNDSHHAGAMDVNGESLVARRCRFEGNDAGTYGGGAFADSGTAMTWVDCTFIANTAIAQGGAMFLLSGLTTTITHCRFFGNVADRIDGSGSTGGAIELAVVNTAITNSLFSGNFSERGGAISTGVLAGGSLTLDSCTFTGNTALESAGAIRLLDLPGTGVVRNCVFWGNSDASGTGLSAQIGPAVPDVAFSLIQDDDPNDASIPFGGAANGNIDDAPMFVDPDGADDTVGTEDDDPRLAAGSPGIDAGDSSVVPLDTADVDEDGDVLERTPYDLAHNARFANDPGILDTGVADPPDYPLVVDMGAFETTGVGAVPTVSTWGLGIMLLLLLTAATLAMNRRTVEA